MKKHTKLMVLIGILFCNISIIQASNNNNGPYSPAIIIPTIVNFIKVALATAASQIIVHEILQGWQITKTNSESLWEYLTASQPKLDTITHEELQSQPNLIINTLQSLPEKIQTILNTEQASGTGEHQFMLLYGLPGTGKTTLAQQIALHTGGNYYHVHQKLLDNYSDATVARFLRAYVQTISDQTTDGKVSTLHLEEFGKQLGKSKQNNDIHNFKHGQYENTWKELLQDLEINYPKVRVIACSNFGQDENSEIFNNAIANERAHIIKIDEPNETARKTYFTATCIAHLENQGIKQSQNITQSIKNQTARNDELSKDYFITQAMHAAAQHKHTDKINKLSTPWNIAIIMQPWLWNDTWNKNNAAQNLNTQGYHTPIVDYNIKNPMPAQAQMYADLTNGLRYRQLNEITELARIDKLQQIQRMKQKQIKNNTAYIIDTKNRTFSIKTNAELNNNNDNAIETITAPFGTIQPHDLIRAATIQRKKDLLELKTTHPEITVEINKELKQLPATDIKDLAQKLKNKQLQIIAQEYKNNIDIKNNGDLT